MSLELHDEYLGRDTNKLATDILNAVGMGDCIDKSTNHLSGGQKQRVAIARALAGHPKLILADEPTAALDKQSGRDIVEIMKSLAKEKNCTILLVTHDHRIFDIADRIICVEDGHLIDR